MERARGKESSYPNTHPRFYTHGQENAEREPMRLSRGRRVDGGREGGWLECQERIQRGIEREREGESTSEPGDATDGANVEKREEEELRENESAHCKRERRQREKDERSESRERA